MAVSWAFGSCKKRVQIREVKEPLDFVNNILAHIKGLSQSKEGKTEAEQGGEGFC